MAPPIPPPETRTLQTAGVRRKDAAHASVGELVRALRALNQDATSLVALFDARAVRTERHLLSAWAHLGRARARGETRLRDRSAELALYVAGDDQLPRALKKVGVRDDTVDCVLAAERPRALPALCETLGLEPALEAFPGPVTEATLAALGIEKEERQVVPPEAWEGLILERIALVDLSAPHAEHDGKPKRPPGPT